MKVLNHHLKKLWKSLIAARVQLQTIVLNIGSGWRQLRPEPSSVRQTDTTKSRHRKARSVKRQGGVQLPPWLLTQQRVVPKPERRLKRAVGVLRDAPQLQTSGASNLEYSTMVKRLER